MGRRGASQRRPPPPDDAFLGIDLGTTSSRAVIVVPKTQQTYDVLHTTGGSSNGRFTEGEFSSTIYPIDGNVPLYNGNIIAQGRVAMSAKLSFPSLVSKKFVMELYQEGYALVLSHLELLKDDGARQRAVEGIKELFKTISRCLDTQFSGEGDEFTIRAIGLSIPAHWTLDFEDLYRSIIIETFNGFQGEIKFLTEAEALGHYLFRDHHKLIIPAKRGPGKNSKGEKYEEQDHGRSVVLVLDFGGHNMNGCIMDIVSGSQEEYPGFYHLTKAKDAGGGSEQGSDLNSSLSYHSSFKSLSNPINSKWEHYVAEECIGMMMEEGVIRSRQDVKPEQRQLILDDFNAFKKDMPESSNKKFYVSCLLRDGSKAYLPEPLDHGEIIAAHKKAFESAFQVADSMIKEAAVLSNQAARIIVTGGSIKSRLTEEKLKELCQKHGIDENNLVCIAKRGVHGLNMRVAHGAAYAIAHQLSVKEFMNRGTAFGMQLRTFGTRTHRDRDQEPWNDQASLIFSQARPHNPVRFNSNGLCECKIICDPFFRDSKSDFLLYNKCYDVLDFGRLRLGRWTFYMNIIDTDQGTSLRLQGKGIDYVNPNRVLLKKTWVFDMYTNVGANAVHLGSPDKTPYEIFGEIWKDVRPDKQETSTTSVRNEQTREGSRRMPTRNNEKKGHGVCLGNALPPMELSTIRHLPRSYSHRPTGNVIEATPRLGQDDILEEHSTENRSADSASRFTSANLTAVNQAQRVEDIIKVEPVSDDDYP
ncbi:hypothetical protein NPX13_g2207 [Xylaria arbuscula]|uniref:Uncharacterized protein n=1 Tax=Xylaria arbuscula TaxID=114810 RepID=A0A9W8NKU5_9PEZI|nr:hypothetical protein NPX13_g2207 [Xylaria arbuscula]